MKHIQGQKHKWLLKWALIRGADGRYPWGEWVYKCSICNKIK